MPTARAVRAKPPEAPCRNPQEPRPGPVRAAGGGTGTQLRVPAGRQGRTSSCPRDRDQRGTTTVALPGARVGWQGAAARRTHSSSAAPRPTERRSRTEPGTQRTPGTTNMKGPAAQKEAHRSTRGDSRWAAPSHRAFTVIPPDPKKRKEIQRKAEAELAALEELRLSRAMSSVSINPSRVGGCLSLEEVRLKQQQEMKQAKKKPMRKRVLEDAPALTC